MPAVDESGDLFQGAYGPRYGADQGTIDDYRKWNSTSGDGAPPQYGGAPGGAASVANTYGSMAARADQRAGVQADLGNANQSRDLGMQSRGQSQD